MQSIRFITRCFACVFACSGVALGLNVSFSGSTSGPAVTPWSGLVRGNLTVTGYSETLSGVRTWTTSDTVQALPSIPEESWWPRGREHSPHPLYDLIQGIVDYIMGCHQPQHPPVIDELTGGTYLCSLQAANPEFGIVVSASGAQTPALIRCWPSITSNPSRFMPAWLHSMS
ncbi:hypothetical protein RAS1_34310 [Phycisphaerae bacterium RAS1]|nr:hypothetical protein RAS1_34310 [Phycisphaerae bacterium RAS1]